ncbi:hypothetical protein [Flagellimonas pacifica]|uniref:Plasmid mobilization relaxosome protein MobC n=1 Tax=Flagellimonas pacifica TaxID=1247520 RepID=A0A285MV34_9FLAO|nr:hypothetical protein [Allomuricauda parva]SNZ00978.1 hypothetical protein SAMN06265377_2808 [Allomuricauda parva]
MEQRKRGRKRLGNKKRYHNVMLRFNDTEYDKLRKICAAYNLDISERGVISPLLRRLVLKQESVERDMLPDTSNLAYHINKIGNNINQLVKIAHHKNLRSPNSNLEREIKQANDLLYLLVEITMEEKTG